MVASVAGRKASIIHRIYEGTDAKRASQRILHTVLEKWHEIQKVHHPWVRAHPTVYVFRLHLLGGEAGPPRQAGLERLQSNGPYPNVTFFFFFRNVQEREVDRKKNQ